jgi:CheY-like chemotaxis protein
MVWPPGLERDLDLYVSALGDAGFATTAVGTAAAAAEHLAGVGTFDLIVMDLLPEPEEAWALIERACANPSWTSVMLLTSVIRPARRTDEGHAHWGVPHLSETMRLAAIRLPGGLFRRAYVRAFAAEVGLNAGDASCRRRRHGRLFDQWSDGPAARPERRGDHGPHHERQHRKPVRPACDRPPQGCGHANRSRISSRGG